MKWTLFWGAQCGKQYCLQISGLPGFTVLTTHPTVSATLTLTTLTLTPQAISGKPSCIPTIFPCSLSQCSFAKSQWSLEILVGDLQYFVGFRSNVLVLFLCLHFGFGREQGSAFSLMLSSQLNTLAPKGRLGVFLNYIGNSVSWLNSVTRTTVFSMLGCIYTC